MTAAKSLEHKEVERVTASLRDALKNECPDYDEAFLEFPPAAPKPASKRGAVLWEAYRLAWSAAARFRRQAERGRAKKRGEGEAFFDDRQSDAAVSNLERARTFVRNARLAVEKDINRIRKARSRQGLQGDDVGELPKHVNTMEEITEMLELCVRRLKTFQGIPQAQTRSEWDDFVSVTAKKLLAAGFGTREVAGLLTGRKPEGVDRATLERFRQRVSRRVISQG